LTFFLSGLNHIGVEEQLTPDNPDIRKISLVLADEVANHAELDVLLSIDRGPPLADDAEVDIHRHVRHHYLDAVHGVVGNRLAVHPAILVDAPDDVLLQEFLRHLLPRISCFSDTNNYTVSEWFLALKGINQKLAGNRSIN
jgi:hypothetical protein